MSAQLMSLMTISSPPALGVAVIVTLMHPLLAGVCTLWAQTANVEGVGTVAGAV